MPKNYEKNTQEIKVESSAANFSYHKEMAALKKTHCLVCYSTKITCICARGVKLTKPKK